MTANGNGQMMNRVLIGIIALLCIGCGAPRPIRQPISISQPFPMPIGQPFPQPIAQPIPQPIAQPISQPIGQPISQPNSGIFLLSGSATQQATVQTALSRCNFPFDRLRPGLRQQGLSSVKISWEPLGEGTLGWASTAGEIGISNSIGGMQAQRTAILELGHIVDFFYLTPDMRKAIIKLWHPGTPDDHQWFGSTRYWDRNGEAYSTLFLWAFADEEMWIDAGYSHKPSRELAAQLRAILLPQVAMR